MGAIEKIELLSYRMLDVFHVINYIEFIVIEDGYRWRIQTTCIFHFLEILRHFLWYSILQLLTMLFCKLQSVLSLNRDSDHMLNRWQQSKGCADVLNNMFDVYCDELVKTENKVIAWADKATCLAPTTHYQQIQGQGTLVNDMPSNNHFDMQSSVRLCK